MHEASPTEMDDVVTVRVPSARSAKTLGALPLRHMEKVAEALVASSFRLAPSMAIGAMLSVVAGAVPVTVDDVQLPS
jgi:hypothetical protein